MGVIVGDTTLRRAGGVDFQDDLGATATTPARVLNEEWSINALKTGRRWSGFLHSPWREIFVQWVPSAGGEGN